MKLKSKVLLAVAILCCSVLLAGCGGGDKPADDATGDKKIEYAKGVISETGFESEYLNLKFALPSGYIMATEAEMQEMSDFGTEIAYSDADKKIIDYAQANTVYEMMVVETAGVPNVSLMVEKVKLENVTTEQYIDALKTQLTDVPDMGYTFPNPVATATIAGQEYSLLTGIMSTQGITITQEYYIRKNEDRIICFIATFTDEFAKAKDDLMAAFTPLK